MSGSCKEVVEQHKEQVPEPLWEKCRGHPDADVLALQEFVNEPEYRYVSREAGKENWHRFCLIEKEIMDKVWEQGFTKRLVSGDTAFFAKTSLICKEVDLPALDDPKCFPDNHCCKAHKSKWENYLNKRAQIFRLGNPGNQITLANVHLVTEKHTPEHAETAVRRLRAETRVPEGQVQGEKGLDKIFVIGDLNRGNLGGCGRKGGIDHPCEASIDGRDELWEWKIKFYKAIDDVPIPGGDDNSSWLWNYDWKAHEWIGSERAVYGEGPNKHLIRDHPYRV